ncbi:MAG: hypothetical protein ACREOZ_02155 [Gloeomargaritales cyanobacterium]
MSNPIPSIGRIVHYVSYGTPGGEYTSECRASIVTGLTNEPEIISVCVVNPTGMFFNVGIYHDEINKSGGTWHWPERV